MKSHPLFGQHRAMFATLACVEANAVQMSERWWWRCDGVLKQSSLQGAREQRVDALCPFCLPSHTGPTPVTTTMMVALLPWVGGGSSTWRRLDALCLADFLCFGEKLGRRNNQAVRSTQGALLFCPCTGGASHPAVRRRLLTESTASSA